MPQLEAPISGILFSDPRPLSNRTVDEVALSFADYGHLKSLLLIQIAHIECKTIARHLPIVFSRRGSVVDMNALLGLRPGRTIISVLSELSPEAQPLLLRAFPLGIGGRDGDGRVRLVADAVPVGRLASRIPAFAPDGSLSPPLLDKADALWLYAAAESATREMLAALDAASAFVSWKLRLVFEDGVAPIDDLLTIAPDFCEDPRYLELVTHFGMDLVHLVEHHLLGKPRINWLAYLDGEIGRAESEGRR